MKVKNRTDRSGLVAVPDKAEKAAAPAKSAAQPAGKPRVELEQDRKWVVEYQVGGAPLPNGWWFAW